MAFHLHRDGKAVEFPLEDLRAMARGGELRQDEYVYDDVKTEWLGAAMVPELEGAWNIEEEEATVAMQLPPDFFDKIDEEEQAAALLDAATAKDPLPAVPSAPTPPAEPSQEEATRAMDLVEMEREMAAAAGQQKEFTVAVETSKPRRVQPGRSPPMGGAVSPNRALGKLVNPIVAALLACITCGIIYPMIYIWKRGNEVNAFLGKEVLPKWILPAIGVGYVVFVIPGVLMMALWGFKLGDAVNEMARTSRLKIGDRKLIYAVCAMFTPVLLFLAQTDLNEIWESNGALKK